MVVLASGEGTLLQHLIDACAGESFGVRPAGPEPAAAETETAAARIQAVAGGAEIVAVGADRDGTGAIRRAQAAGIATFICRVSDYADRSQWDEALTSTCASFRPELVVSAGFLKLFGEQFLAEFSGRCINSHPALLPSFPGLHGVRDALAYGVKVTGCTVFLVDAGLDSGPVIAQAAVPAHDDDDEEMLTERVKAAERVLLTDTVGAMISGGWSVSGRQVRIGGSGGIRR